MVSWTVSTLELGLALLDEGAHALAGVLAGEEQGELVGLVLETAYEVYVHGAVSGRLRVPDGEGSVGGDLGCQLPGRVQRVARADDAVDEAHLAGLLGAYAAAGEDQLLGERGPDEAWQALGATHAWEDPERDLGKTEGRVLGGNAHVAGKRHLAAPAEREAVDGSDRRGGAPIEEGHRSVPDLREALGLDRVHGAHGPYVGPRDKRPLPSARDDDGARRLDLQLEQRLPDLLDHLLVQGVQLLLAVDGHDGDAVLTL